jgi:hypothetical protein
MKELKLLLLFFLLCSTAIVAQRKKRDAPPPPPPPRRFKIFYKRENSNCGKKHHHSAEKRMSNYPFALTTNIKLVSFKPTPCGFSDKCYELPIKNDTICFSKLHEVKTLSLKDINELTNLLYNYDIIDQHECHFFKVRFFKF